MGLFDFLKRETESDHDAAIRLYDEATQEYSAKRYAAAVKLYEQAWSKDPDVNTFFNPSCRPERQLAGHEQPWILLQHRLRMHPRQGRGQKMDREERQAAEP